MKWILLFFVVVGGACAAFAAPSVLVGTINLAVASVPRTLTAYGSLQAGPDGQMVITTLAAGETVRSVDVVAGQTVAAGQTLMILSASPQAQADYQKASAAVDAATMNRAHVAALLASHLATNADLAVADQAASDAAAALRALQLSGAGGTSHSIAAPFAGVVSAVLVTTGASTSAGTALLQISNPHDMVAIIGVPPAMAGQIAPNERATITALSGGAAMRGQVMQAGNAANPQSGLIDVTISLDQSETLLNAPVRATIVTGTLSGFIVPRDAVQNDEQGDYVFQVSNGIAHRESVQILGDAGDDTILAPVLNPALPLVTTGAYQLSDGMAVRTAP